MSLQVRNVLAALPAGEGYRLERVHIGIRDGAIAAIDPAAGPDQPSAEGGPWAEALEAPDCLAIPGLINGHTHSHAVLARGTFRNLPLEVASPLIAAGRVGASEREVYVGALLQAAESLRHGTTALLDHLEQPEPGLEAAAQAYLDAGIRAVLVPSVRNRPYHETLPGGAEAVPPELRARLEAGPLATAGAYLATCRRLVKAWHGRAGRLTVGIGPSTPFRCTEDVLEGARRLAAEEGLILHTHLLETRVQAATAWQLHGRSMVAYARDLGLLGPRTSLAHAIWVEAADLPLLAASGASIVHNPISNFVSGAGIAPIQRLRAAGMPIALGTDSPNTGGLLSVFESLRLVASLANTAEPDYERWIGPAEGLRMATAAGARALGLAGQTGELAVGQRGDLVLVDLRRTWYTPLHDPLFQLAYGETGAGVDTVIVEGRVLVRGGRLLTIDEEALMREAIELGEAMMARNREEFAFARSQEPFIRRIYRAVHGLPDPPST
jgi:cytosine/adenosine deaminase-related metal-dependent hydrolase